MTIKCQTSEADTGGGGMVVKLPLERKKIINEQKGCDPVGLHPK